MDEELVFLQAVEFDNPDERVTFLDSACGNDRRLRASVDSLLKHHASAGTFLETPPVELQQTFAMCQADTIESRGREGLLALLSTCDKPDCIGQLGPYEIIKIIDTGGMGTVLRARDTKLNREVAIKVLAATGAPGQGSVKRLIREAQTAAAVKHEHVVTIHAIHDEGPLPYIVMELVEGISLQQKIDRTGALDVDEICRIGIQIAAGLAAAHQRGLIHRDIKPANILLESGTGRVKIADFGLARAVEDGKLSLDGEIAGTPQFMSPEQAQGRKADHRSDLFSLGSVLFTMCTGQPAFSAETAIAILRGICDDTPRPVHELNKVIPQWLSEMIRRLLEKDPDQRPQNAHEVVDLLSRKSQVLQMADLSKSPTIEIRHTVPPTRNRWPIAARASAAAIGLTCVIIIIVNRNGKTTRTEIPDGATARVTAMGDVEVELPPEKVEPTSSRLVPPQVQAVAVRLVQLNPGFDGKVTPTISNDDITELQINADHVRDLSPLKDLKNLRSLVCNGTNQDSSQLKDLTPLHGMTLHALELSNTQVADLTPLKGMPLSRLNLNHTPVSNLQPLTVLPLERLYCAGTKVNDLAPLKNLPLCELHIQDTQVTDLSPLRGMPLTHLNLSATRVTNLSPLQGMQLIAVYCDATRVADLSPLKEMPLKELNWRGYDQTNARHQEVVRSISTLEIIDSLSVDEFRRKLDTRD